MYGSHDIMKPTNSALVLTMENKQLLSFKNRQEPCFFV
jgi:hypothetical protein